MPMLITNIYNLLLAITVLVVLVGLIPLLSKSTHVATWGEVIGHTIGVPALFGLLYLIVPRFKKVFSDFGTELPDATKRFMMLSDTFVAYWYLVVPPLVAVLVFDGVKFNAWHRNEETRPQAQAMSAVITAAIAALFLWAAVALGMPMFNLIEDLT